jgi:hypothetical protein
MTVWSTLVDLAERRRLLPDTAGEYELVASGVVLEGKLGAGKQAHGYVPVMHRSKTARHRVVKSSRD